ncbi:hypothetical protein G9F32_12215 [Acinetobacter sp. 194]|uniref:hypothetical protein n=1 Tax=Acinetobacter shaoyimingii TaxID=2715164 RepID=UPI00140DD16D|nr:hypothetical protein [Acinetobacter shaoyimingii]NHB58773.1 hypothetical protein [Acinetobacter shaoyimingii]
MRVGSSPAAGSICTTCLRKFTVHFRRPYKLSSKAIDQITRKPLYNGEYGFDWLRDEYLNSLTLFAKTKGGTKSYSPVLKEASNRYRVNSLKENYTQGIKKVSPFGNEYIPSHLALFSTNLDKPDPNGSTEINKNGALLWLEIHQISGDDSTPLTNDGTVLYFESSHPSIKISTANGNEKKTKVSIPLSKVLNNYSQLKLDSGVRKFYQNKNFLRVSCEGSTHSGGYIEVKAKKGDVEEVVGLMALEANNKIPKAEICLVNVMVNSNPVYQPEGLEYRLKYQSFNQALIRAEIVKRDDFDVFKLYVKHRTKDLEDFLNKYYYKAPKDPKTKNSIVDKEESNNFNRELCLLYEKYRNVKPINSDETKITYAFFSNIIFKTLNSERLGLAVRGKEHNHGNKLVWGNAVVMFNGGSSDLETVVHEIIHSFSLTHIFSDNVEDRKFSMYQGLTDNFMDYKDMLADGESLFKGNQISLFRIQWKNLKKDRSVRYV